MTDGILANDISCENAVLGSIIANENVLPEIEEYLSPDCFYDWRNQKIFAIIVDTYRKGDPTDIVFVGGKIMSDGTLSEVYEHFVDEVLGNSTRDYKKYAQRLKDLEIRRGLWRLSKVIEGSCFDDTKDSYEIISDINRSVDKMLLGTPTETVITMSDALSQFLKVVNDNTNGTTQSGFMTDFKIIDENGGLHPSDLFIIAAESSAGKTSLAINIVRNAARYGTPVAIYSMEMTNVQLMARMVSMDAGINNKSLLYKAQDGDRLSRIDESVGRLEQLPIYLDERSTSSIDSIVAGIRRMSTKFGVKIFVIDYIQMLTINSGKSNRNEEQMLGEMARRLKNIAKEMNVCIIALSQLSRNLESPLPTLNRLRGSGQLVEAADVIMLLYRPEAVKNGKQNLYPSEFSTVSTDGTAMLIIGKGRNTGLAECIVGFESKYTRFYELDNAPDIIEGNSQDQIVARKAAVDDVPF